MNTCVSFKPEQVIEAYSFDQLREKLDASVFDRYHIVLALDTKKIDQRTNQPKNVKRYFYCPNIEKMIKFYERQDEKAFYEVCFHPNPNEWKQRYFYFDLDMEVNKLFGGITEEKANEVVADVIDATRDLYRQVTEKTLPYRSILTFRSHRPHKFSFHLVFKFTVQSREEALEFFFDVQNKIKPEYRTLIDEKVYSKNQCFRLLGSHKLNAEGGFKKYYRFAEDSTYYRGTNGILEASLISYQCSNPINYLEYKKKKDLPRFVKPKVIYPQTKQTITQPNKNETLVPSDRDALEVLSLKLKVPYETFFLVRQILTSESSRQIILDRIAPSPCFRCLDEKKQPRIHENENPYIFYTMSGDVYFNCRRREGNAVSIPIGNIEPSTELFLQAEPSLAEQLFPGTQVDPKMYECLVKQQEKYFKEEKSFEEEKPTEKAIKIGNKIIKKAAPLNIPPQVKEISDPEIEAEATEREIEESAGVEILADSDEYFDDEEFYETEYEEPKQTPIRFRQVNQRWVGDEFLDYHTDSAFNVRLNHNPFDDENQEKDLNQKCILLKSPLGTGKTEWIIRTFNRIKAKLGRPLRIIYITPRVVFAASVRERLSQAGYEFSCYYDTEVSKKKLIIQVESLHKLFLPKDNYYDIAVLDESESIASQATVKKTNRENLTENIDRMASLIRNTPLVIMADAFLSKLTVTLAHNVVPVSHLISWENKYLVREFRDKTTSELLTCIHDGLKAGQRMFIVSANKKWLLHCRDYLMEKFPQKRQCYHYGNDGTPLENFASVVDEWGKSDLVITTTKITVGISFDQKNHFHWVGAYFDRNGGVVRDIFQALGRVRYPIDNTRVYQISSNPSIEVDLPSISEIEDKLTHMEYTYFYEKIHRKAVRKLYEKKNGKLDGVQLKSDKVADQMARMKAAKQTFWEERQWHRALKIEKMIEDYSSRRRLDSTIASYASKTGNSAFLKANYGSSFKRDEWNEEEVRNVMENDCGETLEDLLALQKNNLLDHEKEGLLLLRVLEQYTIPSKRVWLDDSIVSKFLNSKTQRIIFKRVITLTQLVNTGYGSKNVDTLLQENATDFYWMSGSWYSCCVLLKQALIVLGIEDIRSDTIEINFGEKEEDWFLSKVKDIQGAFGMLRTKTTGLNLCKLVVRWIGANIEDEKVGRKQYRENGKKKEKTIYKYYFNGITQFFLDLRVINPIEWPL